MYIILVLHTRVDDFVVIDESIVRVAVGCSRGAWRQRSRRRLSAGQRFVPLVVQSVDEEVIWTDRMGGYIPTQVDWIVVQLGRVT